MKKRDFYRYFGIPEFKSIAGKRYKNLIILSIIIFIALMAIGLGNSSTNYLKEKMDNPFIKFVNVNIPYNSLDKSFDIRDFSNTKLEKHFDYNEVSPIYFTYIDFKGNDGKTYNAFCRVVNDTSEFYNFLVNDSKIALTDFYFNNSSYGIIITKKFLNKLGVSDYDKSSYIDYVNYKSGDSLIPFPIAGVVSQLPDYNDIIISEAFYKSLKGYKCLDINSDNHKVYLKFYIPNENSLNETLTNMNFSLSSEDNILTNEGIIIIKNGISNYQSEKEELLKKYPNAIQIFDFNRSSCDGNTEFGQPDLISFSFSTLDSIKPFQNYLLNEYKLKIDMNTIEAKENFTFFNKLSILLSFSLIIFSIITIFIFITNLILNHLESNKQNLGTLKAFGLDNNKIIHQYSIISIALIVLAFIIAYLITYFTGNYILDFLLKISNIKTDQGIKYQNISLLILSFVFVLTPTLIIYYRLRKYLVGKTPGDLIYDR